MPLLIIASAFWDEKGNIIFVEKNNCIEGQVGVETSTEMKRYKNKRKTNTLLKELNV